MGLCGDAAIAVDTVAMLRRAAEPWSLSHHRRDRDLYPESHGRRVADLLLIGLQLSARVEGHGTSLYDAWVGCVLPRALARHKGQRPLQTPLP